MRGMGGVGMAGKILEKSLYSDFFFYVVSTLYHDFSRILPARCWFGGYGGGYKGAEYVASTATDDVEWGGGGGGVGGGQIRWGLRGWV